MSEKVLISKSKLDRLALSILQKAGLQGKKTLDDLGVIIDELSGDAQGPEVSYTDTGERVIVSKSKLNTLANKILTKAGLEGSANLDELTTIVKELSFGPPETPASGPTKFRVERVTTDSYVDSTSYTGDNLISFNIYSDPYNEYDNKDIIVKYNGEIIQTIQQVVDSEYILPYRLHSITFGKYMGVDDDTAESGIIEVSGPSFLGIGNKNHSTGKSASSMLGCIKEIIEFGEVTHLGNLSSCDFSKYNGVLSLSKITKFIDPTFQNNLTIREAYFKNVGSLPNSAFSGCTNLTQTSLNSVTSISSNAFQNCSSLTSITISDSVTSVGQYVFDYCSSLTSITIPDSVTSVGLGAFRGCSSLTSITIPFIGSNSPTPTDSISSDSTLHLGYIFGASKYSDSNTYVPTSLKEVKLTGSTTIKKYSFYDCVNITSLEIPSSVTTIEQYSLSGLDGLEKLVVDNNNLIYDSRNNCNACIETSTNKLICATTNTIIPNNISIIGTNAFGGLEITNIIIPSSVMNIENSAFQNCKKLLNITIPNSVITIGVSAFNSCIALTHITIPESVVSIGDSAFYGCELEEVIILGSRVLEIPSDSYIFGECERIVFPNQETLNLYLNNENWVQHADKLVVAN